jgi:hypothetical protein
MAKTQTEPALTPDTAQLLTNELLIHELDVNALAEALAAPFDPGEVKFKPQAVKGDVALAVPFVDARVIEDRLDSVLGIFGWQDSYEPLPDGAVICRLRIRAGKEWIIKEDVGGQSEQPDEGDRRKAAFSDALKRAAVKFGIGRYLYRVKPQWCEYDSQKKRWIKQPSIPVNASPTPKFKKPQPEPEPVTKAEPTPAPAPASNSPAVEQEKKPAKSKAAATTATSRKLPANGAELHERLKKKDAEMAKAGLCQAGDLLKYVVREGDDADFGKDIEDWPEEAIQLAVESVKAFESQRKAAQKQAA